MLVGVVSSLGQVVLNFDDLILADYSDIPGTYGDNLDPNVPDIQYRTLRATDFSVLTGNLDLWNNDYGDLTRVAFPTSNGNVGEITFVPASGYGVRLVSFEMAGWSHRDRSNSIMRLLDGSGNVLLDFAAAGPVAIQGDTTGPQHSTFTPNLTHFGTLRLQWGTDWDIGIDNIRFEAVAIPEPSVVVFLGLGAGCLWLLQMRRAARRS